LVDDSIIRGTVSKRTIALARNAGAKKIFFASTFPPVLYPCIYGIDFPCKSQLIAPAKSLKEIAEEIGADVVIYNDVEVLKEAIGLKDLCLACVTGQYPTSTEGMEHLRLLRKQDQLAMV
jgi:amidophosphoribosyltransferase